MKIVVLAGGLSTERDVSLTSGAGICRTLLENGHQAVLMDAFMGIPYDADKLEDLFSLPDAGLSIASGISADEPDLAAIRASRADQSPCLLGPNVIALCQMADIVFMGLLRRYWRKRKTPGYFRCTGNQIYRSELSRQRSGNGQRADKKIFRTEGVPTPKGTWLYKSCQDTSLTALGLSLPVVVKPCSGGSSVGVYIVHTEEEYNQAIEASFRYEDELIIEEYIKGREFAVGIIEGKALPVIEIIPNSGFFDYKNKYQDGCTQEICPAQIPEDIAHKMQCAAEKAFAALKLDVYSRADFLLTENGDIYCLEVNSLPGMTPASLLPKEAGAAGINYSELCEMIIEKSLARYSKTV